LKLELIPVIELPTFKYKDLEQVTDVKAKRKLLIERNYSEVHKLKPLNEIQYKISEISDVDLLKAIELHISDLQIKDSCAFFGGYALKVNDEIILHPQCCGLLSEIEDWKILLNEDFKPFYLKECHPSPKFCKINDEIHIECNPDETGSFEPKTQNMIIVKHDSLMIALNELLTELKKLSERLNRIYPSENNLDVSKILIWNE